MYDSLISPVKVNHFKMFLIDTNAITGEKFPQQNTDLFNRFYLKNEKTLYPLLYKDVQVRQKQVSYI